MDNALGEPQTILLLGGTSDIGLAIVRELLSPSARTVAPRTYAASNATRARPTQAGPCRGLFASTARSVA